ncbi:hypothetical protein N657DRAFT_635596 [Parathielavia appendiculata]|uniref:Uncharacterized protein n=1 Tax=Parathielavia appendiculata TaxID=2587402 RepID=A0AAN6TVP9_9PEZI|nr:hypothetical protein N657DRAFT_635596 [Parathielavia appendiculata]
MSSQYKDKETRKAAVEATLCPGWHQLLVPDRRPPAWKVNFVASLAVFDLHVGWTKRSTPALGAPITAGLLQARLPAEPPSVQLPRFGGAHREITPGVSGFCGDNTWLWGKLNHQGHVCGLIRGPGTVIVGQAESQTDERDTLLAVWVPACLDEAIDNYPSALQAIWSR